jgi:hypothetical protein
VAQLFAQSGQPPSADTAGCSLQETEWQTSHSSHLPGKDILVLLNRGWVGPTGGPNAVVKKHPCQESKPSHHAHSRQRFIPTSCLAYSSTMKMKAESSSKTSVNFYQTAQHHIPQDFSS